MSFYIRRIKIDGSEILVVINVQTLKKNVFAYFYIMLCTNSIFWSFPLSKWSPPASCTWNSSDSSSIGCHPSSGPRAWICPKGSLSWPQWCWGKHQLSSAQWLPFEFILVMFGGCLDDQKDSENWTGSMQWYAVSSKWCRITHFHLG
jgi:hypothetical protein